MTALDTMAVAAHTEWTPGVEVRGRGDLATNRPDVHVVPLADLRWHAVPGGYPEETGTEVHTSGLGWLAVEAEDGAFTRDCPCYPSVRQIRHGTVLGRVLVHHAHDGRPTGQQLEPA